MAVLNSDIFIARAELFALAPMFKTLSHNDMIYPCQAAMGSMRKGTTQSDLAVRQWPQMNHFLKSDKCPSRTVWSRTVQTRDAETQSKKGGFNGAPVYRVGPNNQGGTTPVAIKLFTVEMALGQRVSCKLWRTLAGVMSRGRLCISCKKPSLCRRWAQSNKDSRRFRSNKKCNGWGACRAHAGASKGVQDTLMSH